MGDMVNEPPHYRWLPMNIEAIDITELFNFNLGNALKYILRSKHKGREIEDLKKAQWYIAREIKRIEKEMQEVNAISGVHPRQPLRPVA